MLTLRNAIASDCNWPHALWAWPLKFFAIASVIGLAHNTERLGLLHRQYPLAYGGLGGLSIGLCFYLRRFGLKLTPVFGESGIKSDWDIRPWIKVFIVVCFVAAVALITHRWLATLASFAICLAVTGLFYVFSRKNNGNNVEATSPGDSLKAPPEK